jgi:hypothetical protein
MTELDSRLSLAAAREAYDPAMSALGAGPWVRQAEPTLQR